MAADDEIRIGASFDASGLIEGIKNAESQLSDSFKRMTEDSTAAFDVMDEEAALYQQRMEAMSAMVASTTVTPPPPVAAPVAPVVEAAPAVAPALETAGMEEAAVATTEATEADRLLIVANEELAGSTTTLEERVAAASARFENELAIQAQVENRTRLLAAANEGFAASSVTLEERIAAATQRYEEQIAATVRLLEVQDALKTAFAVPPPPPPPPPTVTAAAAAPAPEPPTGQIAAAAVQQELFADKTEQVSRAVADESGQLSLFEQELVTVVTPFETINVEAEALTVNGGLLSQVWDTVTGVFAGIMDAFTGASAAAEGVTTAAEGSAVSAQQVAAAWTNAGISLGEGVKASDQLTTILNFLNDEAQVNAATTKELADTALNLANELNRLDLQVRKTATGFQIMATTEHEAAAATGGLNSGLATAGARTFGMEAGAGKLSYALGMLARSVEPLGKIFAAAFPVIFAVAMIEIVDELINKFMTMQDTIRKTANEWNDLADSVTQKADALELDALKTEDAYRKLIGGQPKNRLAEQILEAKERTDQLLKSLRDAQEKSIELLTTKSTSFLEGIASNQVPTSPYANADFRQALEQQRVVSQMTERRLGAENEVAELRDKLAQATDATEKKNLQDQLNTKQAALQTAINNEMASLTEMQKRAEKLVSEYLEKQKHAVGGQLTAEQTQKLGRQYGADVKVIDSSKAGEVDAIAAQTMAHYAGAITAAQGLLNMTKEAIRALNELPVDQKWHEKLGGAEAAQQQISEFKEILNKKKQTIDENHEMSKQVEIDYWAWILQHEQLNAAQRAAVNQELVTLRKSQAAEDIQNLERSFQEQLKAAGNNYDARLKIALDFYEKLQRLNQQTTAKPPVAPATPGITKPSPALDQIFTGKGEGAVVPNQNLQTGLAAALKESEGDVDKILAEEVRKSVQAFRVEYEEARKNSLDRITLAQQELDKLNTLHATSTAQYAAVERQLTEAIRNYWTERNKLAEDAIHNQAQLAEIALSGQVSHRKATTANESGSPDEVRAELAEAEAKYQIQLGEINKEETLYQTRAQAYQNALQTMKQAQQELATMEADGITDANKGDADRLRSVIAGAQATMNANEVEERDWEQLEQKKVVLTKQYEQEKQAIRDQYMKAWVQLQQQVNQQLERAYSQFFQSIFYGWDSFHKAVVGLEKGMLASFADFLAKELQMWIQFLAKKLEHWIMEHVLEKIIEKIFGTSGDSGSKEKAAQTASTNAGMAESYAGLAAGEAFAYYMPQGGLPEAIGMAAAAEGIGLGFAAQAAAGGAGSAAGGALLDEDGPIFAHANEMIIPSHLSTGIQKMVATIGNGNTMQALGGMAKTLSSRSTSSISGTNGSTMNAHMPLNIGPIHGGHLDPETIANKVGDIVQARVNKTFKTHGVIKR